MDTKLHPGHRALRRGRWSLAGQIYLVSSVTRGRRPYFAGFEAACSASRAMHAFGRTGETKLLAWVLMPDHAHWLLQLGGKESLPQAVNRLKATSARNANRWLDSAGPLWSPGFHDRALRRDDELLDAARYVIANPVRAGLVMRVADYPFWDAIYL